MYDAKNKVCTIVRKKRPAFAFLDLTCKKRYDDAISSCRGENRVFRAARQTEDVRLCCRVTQGADLAFRMPLLNQ